MDVPLTIEPESDPCYLPVEGESIQVLCYYILFEERAAFAQERLKSLRQLSIAADIEGVDSIGHDMRTLGVRRRKFTGERFLGFEDGMNEMAETEFSDWPLEGPRTTKWLGMQMVRSAPGPVARHHRWVKDAEIPSTDRSRFEHHVISEAFEKAVTYDCLQIANLASFEVLSRRLQHIEQAHIENPNVADYSGSEFFMGSSEKKGGALVAPSLALHVAGKFRDEASIAKEQRKAKEAQAPTGPATRTPWWKGKDKGGKGKDEKGKDKGKGKDKSWAPGAPAP